MSKALRIGDVLELPVPAGHVYLHYAGKHKDYGDGIFVSPQTHASRPDISTELFEDAYFTFYPANAAVAKRLVSVVGNVGAPSIPSRLRRAGAREGRLVKTWIVEEGSNETLRRVLSPEERRLPLARIWNHALLLQRISEGWRPEMEVS